MKTRRRRSLALLGGALAAAALPAFAQQPGKIYRIGFLGSTSPTPEVRKITTDRTLQALRERGWVEGRNFVVEERWAYGKSERLPELATQLLQTKVDIIVAGLTDGALAAKEASATVPIVTVLTFDPVRNGLIESYARPGGNVTGLSYEAGTAIGAKHLDLLKQAVPGLSRVAILWNPGGPGQALWLQDMQPASGTLKLELRPVEARSPADFDAAFARMKQERAGGVVVFADTMFFFHRERLAELAIAHRLPSISALHAYPHRGGLIGYVVDIPDSYRRVATYIDKILRGAKPTDLAVEQPTKFQLTVNLKTARAIGLTIPQAVMVRADEVIE